MARSNDSRDKNEDGLTFKQEKFLLLYPEVLNVYKTAQEVGIPRSNIVRDLKKDTPFGIKFRRMVEKMEMDNDPRFSKAGTLGDLFKLEEEIRNDDSIDSEKKYRLILDIKKEINKMIDGNIASTKKVVENKNLFVSGVYDLTKLPEQQTQKTIDIEYTEVNE